MSNRGRSSLRPTRNEKDANVQIWVDRKDLATIGLYMESKGIKLTYMSDILGFCIETVRTLVLKANGKYVADTAEASAFLESRVGVGFTKRGRGNKNLVTNLLGDDAEEMSNLVEKASISPALIAALKEKARELQESKVSGNDLLSSREEKDSTLFSKQGKAFADVAKANLEVVKDDE